MPSKRKKNKKATRRINDSPSAMRVHHPTGEGTTTPKMDNKRSGGFDNETKSQIQKRDDDPSIIGTVVTTLPPPSLSRNPTNSTEREGCSTVSNQVLSDQKPRAAEVSSNDDLKEMLAKMNESLSHLNMQVSDLSENVSRHDKKRFLNRKSRFLNRKSRFLNRTNKLLNRTNKFLTWLQTTRPSAENFLT